MHPIRFCEKLAWARTIKLWHWFTARIIHGSEHFKRIFKIILWDLIVIGRAQEKAPDWDVPIFLVMGGGYPFPLLSYVVFSCFGAWLNASDRSFIWMVDL